MNFKQLLMLTGAAYTVGRLTSNMSGDDIRAFGEKLQNLKGDDVRKYAINLSDDALDRIGLVRKNNVTNSAAMMIGGLGAGILVGAGLALLFAPQAGSDTRAKIGEKVQEIRNRGNGSSEQPETPGTGGPAV